MKQKRYARLVGYVEHHSIMSGQLMKLSKPMTISVSRWNYDSNTTKRIQSSSQYVLVLHHQNENESVIRLVLADAEGKPICREERVFYDTTIDKVFRKLGYVRRLAYKKVSAFKFHQSLRYF